MEAACQDDVAFSVGDAVSLTSVACGLCLSLVVEPVGRGDCAVMLARTTQPYHRLHRSAQKESTVSWKHVSVCRVLGRIHYCKIVPPLWVLCPLLCALTTAHCGFSKVKQLRTACLLPQ